MMTTGLEIIITLLSITCPLMRGTKMEKDRLGRQWPARPPKRATKLQRGAGIEHGLARTASRRPLGLDDAAVETQAPVVLSGKVRSMGCVFKCNYGTLCICWGSLGSSTRKEGPRAGGFELLDCQDLQSTIRKGMHRRVNRFKTSLDEKGADATKQNSDNRKTASNVMHVIRWHRMEMRILFDGRCRRLSHVPGRHAPTGL